MKMRNIVLAATLGLFLAACAMSASKEVSDTQIGLRNVDLFDEKDVLIKDINWSKEPAGMSQKIERSYENAPPLIPHDVTDLVPITKDDNQCLGCHLPSVAADVGATPIPKSHFFDIRHHKDLKDTLDDARYNCTTCHVPQANVKPLVGNSFRPDFRNETGKSSSNLLDVLNEGVK